jgi:glucose/arabinose dehydrogenase
VSEFVRGAEGSVNAAAERVLLTVKQPFSNHNGGMIAFGPDGYLYIALGDGGSGGDPQGNGQNLATRLGKLLRIDVDGGDPYAIPADNPFADGAGGAMPEIWALGLRNPWRFSFDRQSGGLFIADVGQNEFEEINAEPAGQGGRNYGWNIMEADRCFGGGGCSRRGLTLPVAVYSHDQGCSVTGGYVYRGAAFAQLFGGYVFADYCSTTVWAIDADRALAGESLNPIEMGSLGFTASSFGEDEAGELYVVEHDGAIHRLVATPR